MNRQAAKYSKSGAQIGAAQTLNTFFNASGNIFDPHVIFEPQGKHFIAVADQNDANWVVSVSRTSDATGAWCQYTFDARNSGITSVDFPLIGSTVNWVYLSMVEKPANGNRLFEINKSQLESCSPAGGWVWSNINDPGTSTPAHPLVPVLNYDGNDPNGYLVDSFPNGAAHVSLYYIDTSNALHSTAVNTAAYSPAPPAKQKGSTVDIYPGDSAMSEAVNYKNGMYTALTTANGSYSAFYWLHFNPKPGAQTLLGGFAYGFTGLSYMYPTISEAFDGTALLTYSLTGTIYPSAAAVGFDVNSNPTTNNYIWQGSSPYTRITNSGLCGSVPCARWGDYTSTYTDPTNINNFWSTAQTPVNSSTWGTVLALSTP